MPSRRPQKPLISNKQFKQQTHYKSPQRPFQPFYFFSTIRQRHTQRYSTAQQNHFLDSIHSSAAIKTLRKPEYQSIFFFNNQSVFDVSVQIRNFRQNRTKREEREQDRNSCRALLLPHMGSEHSGTYLVYLPFLLPPNVENNLG